MEMADITRETGRRIRGFVWVGVALLLLAVMLYGYFAYPQRAVGIKQPVYFSHRVHAGVKQISCRFCHPFVDRSKNAGIPPVRKCLFCHKYIIPTHPQIVKVREYYDTATPIPWIRIFYLPDHVHFDHRPHVNWAGLDCTECHGALERMDRLVPVEFKMEFCIKCHRQLGAQLDCWLACHR